MKSFRWVVGIALVVMIAMAIPQWVKERRAAALSPCVDNLHQIQSSKLNWMGENRKTTNDTPTWTELKPQLSCCTNRYGWSNGLPVCPNGGTYAIGRVGEPATCSVGGRMHSLSLK